MSTRLSAWPSGLGPSARAMDSAADEAFPGTPSAFSSGAKGAAASVPEGNCVSCRTAEGGRFETKSQDGIWPSAAHLRRYIEEGCLWVWSRIEARRAIQKRRCLRVLETVGMGEKRFIAIVQVEQTRFLIGGGSAGVSLLARLDPEQGFDAVLTGQASAEPVLVESTQ